MKSNLNILIVEDEELAKKRLTILLDDLGSGFNVIGWTKSVRDSIVFLSTTEVDLIFLDINLSDGQSFEIFEEISIKTPIIFLTAYSEYAIKAFERNSVAYLLKPVSRQSLALAIQKFKEFYSNPSHNDLNYQYRPKHYKERFLIKKANSLITVNSENIHYFYIEDKVTFLVLESGKRYIIDMTLKQIENEINPDLFFRMNRKYIIHLKGIVKMVYLSQSKINVSLTHTKSYEEAHNFVAIEKIGKFKRWLDGKI